MGRKRRASQAGLQAPVISKGQAKAALPNDAPGLGPSFYSGPLFPLTSQLALLQLKGAALQAPLLIPRLRKPSFVRRAGPVKSKRKAALGWSDRPGQIYAPIKDLVALRKFRLQRDRHSARFSRSSSRSHGRRVRHFLECCHGFIRGAFIAEVPLSLLEATVFTPAQTSPATLLAAALGKPS